MKKKYVVRLTEAERQALEALVRAGTGAACRRTHAQGLLWADEGDHGPGLIDSEVEQTVGVSEKTLWRMRQRCVEEGLEVYVRRCSHQTEKPVPVMNILKDY